MKKNLLTLALVAMATVSSFAQGTINPLNGPLAGTKVWVDTNADGTKDRLATTADGIQFSIFFGPAGVSAPSSRVEGIMTIGADGVLTGLPTLLALPGAGEGGTIVSLQIVASNAQGWRGATDVKQVTLAPASGPGIGVWSSTASTAKFLPLVVTVPEPSTIALGVLGLGSLLLFRRRK